MPAAAFWNPVRHCLQCSLSTANSRPSPRSARTRHRMRCSLRRDTTRSNTFRTRAYGSQCHSHSMSKAPPISKACACTRVKAVPRRARQATILSVFFHPLASFLLSAASHASRYFSMTFSSSNLQASCPTSRSTLGPFCGTRTLEPFPANRRRRLLGRRGRFQAARHLQYENDHDENRPALGAPFPDHDDLQPRVREWRRGPGANLTALPEPPHGARPIRRRHPGVRGAGSRREPNPLANPEVPVSAAASGISRR